MKQATYQLLEQIINITAMTNKWMRWCEQSLPAQIVFVPSVFQMRDAYSHMIMMFAQGMEAQGLAEIKTEDCIFDEVQFFQSNIVAEQLNEINNHILRAFFDTADYIIEELSEVCKHADSHLDSSSFPLLRNVLNKYDKEISTLRGKKSETPTAAYQTVQRWDALLQVITCAYSFADYERNILDLYRAVRNIIWDIEARFEENIIKEFSPKFYEKKVELAKLKELPEMYEKFISDEEAFLVHILEDPVEWQNKIKEQFNSISDKLNRQLRDYQMLMETIPSTALIRKAKWDNSRFKTGCLGLISIIISALVTAWIEQKMFISQQSATNLLFIVKICLSFSFVEFTLITLGWLIYKLRLRLAQKKYQRKA